MDIFGNLPTWAVLLISFLAAAVLVLLNIGWLLQARGMLEQYSRRRRERERAERGEQGRSDDAPSSERRDLDR